MSTGRVVLLLFAISLLLNHQPTTSVSTKEAHESGSEVLSTQSEKPNSPTLSPSQETAVTVTRVIDGDTVELSTGERLRYIGIDTPEASGQCYSQEAKRGNEALVLGKALRLEKDKTEIDRYGRLLRYVWIEEVFVNEALVRQGLARSYAYPPDTKFQDLFRAAEAEAQGRGVGLWSACSGSPTSGNIRSTAPAGCLIKGNVSSDGTRIYHLPGQSFYDRTVINESAGERWFCSEEEARSAVWRKSKR